jgi:hypothetical protein
MKMDVTATTKRSVAIAVALAGILVILLLAWIGGELHYRNCVADAELRHQVRAGSVDADLAARAEAVDGCSRRP